MKHKSIFACIGALVLTGAIGIGALLSSNTYKESKATTYYDYGDKKLTYLLDDELPAYWGDIDITFNGEAEIKGDFVTSDNRHWGILLIANEFDVEAGHLQYVDLWTSDYSDNERLYYDMGGGFTNYFKNNCLKISVTGLQLPDYFGFNRLSLFWYISGLNSSTFTFANQINYYGPYYNSTINNSYVDDASMTASGVNRWLILYNKPFLCGDVLYNEIRAFYLNAYGFSFDDSSNVMSNHGYATYMWLEYRNTDTNLIEIVNNRDNQLYTENNVTGSYFIKSSTWVNQAYRTIQLLDFDGDVTQLGFSAFNNGYSGAVGLSGSSDVGLGDAFTLIGQGFSAFTSLLSIQVLPGLSLGLLLFLPLIAGIIIAIIWVVKR